MLHGYEIKTLSKRTRWRNIKQNKMYQKKSSYLSLHCFESKSRIAIKVLVLLCQINLQFQIYYKNVKETNAETEKCVTFC